MANMRRASEMNLLEKAEKRNEISELRSEVLLNERLFYRVSHMPALCNVLNLYTTVPSTRKKNEGNEIRNAKTS